jgi:ribosomal protein L10
MLIFQHNNLLSQEWTGIRRELSNALRKVDAARAAAGLPEENLADGIKLQVIQTGIFSSALRVVEYYKPEVQSQAGHVAPLTHVLSEAAHDAAINIKTKHTLEPLLKGPLVLLTLPSVSPQHLKAAISVLSPSAPQFPAPTRKTNPGWHDLPVQTGIQKLLLLGARVEGRVFDAEGAKWVGSIDGGLEGLRGQLVAMLQGLGAGLTNTLESAAKNLYFTVEGRRTMLEDEEKGEALKEETKAE